MVDMASSPNPLLPKQGQPAGPAPTTPAVTAMTGMPGAAASGAGQNALSMMLGPGSSLGPYLKQAGPEYADELDQMEWNPMSVWF